ncbi:hypothetical protein FSP39_012479 [Pinctada imbricata]|uniref:Uncharacterized protein n=1 Tax=Pinctada imbricata TaxID=66713 RepID=A0AA89BUR2_PINIB|nr:hypothetical protein FSP39_012479 [Pinctada imbricata]
MDKYLIFIFVHISTVLGALHLYPSPGRVPASDKFQVFVQQGNQRKQESFTYISKSDMRQKSSSKVTGGRSVSWTSFSFTGRPVTLEIRTSYNFNKCIVRPKSYGFHCRRAGAKRALIVVNSNSKQMSIEFDNDYGSYNREIINKLLVFVDPPEVQQNVPNPDDKGVLYYGRGVHDLNGQKELDSSIREVYLAPGAFVEGGFITRTNHPVKIHGRGVISTEKYRWRDRRFKLAVINIDSGSGHVLEGVTISDPVRFYIRAKGTRNTIRNVKTVASWAYNSDGVVTGTYGLVENSFFMANDDAIKVDEDEVEDRRRNRKSNSLTELARNMVTLEIHTLHDFDSCIVRPNRYGFQCRRTGEKTAHVEVDSNSKQMSIEFDNDYGSYNRKIINKLLVFVDPPLINESNPNDEKVLYYGQGVHDLKGQKELDASIKEVYVAPGAFIKGGFITTADHPVKIHGRGVLSTANYRWRSCKFEWAVINMDSGSGHIIEGVTISDPVRFYIRANGTNNTVRNVKTVAAWTHNSDGVVTGRNGLVENSFFMANDDAIKQNIEVPTEKHRNFKSKTSKHPQKNIKTPIAKHRNIHSRTKKHPQQNKETPTAKQRNTHSKTSKHPQQNKETPRAKQRNTHSKTKKHPQQNKETPTAKHPQKNIKTPIAKHRYIHSKTKKHPQQNKETPTAKQRNTHSKTSKHPQQNKETPTAKQRNTQSKTKKHPQQNKETPTAKHLNTHSKTSKHPQQNKETPTAKQRNTHSKTSTENIETLTLKHRNTHTKTPKHSH